MHVAYDLRQLALAPSEHHVRAMLTDGLDAAPRYERVADAGKRVVECIHAIPDLHAGDEITLGSVEVYVGRTGAEVDYFWHPTKRTHGRWREHFSEKQHRFGMPVLRCSTEVVQAWETAAVRILKSLNDSGRLCVRNASASGQGRKPATRDSYIYLTWKLCSEVEISLPTRPDIGRIADALAPDFAKLVPPITRDSTERALDPITRPRHARADVRWHSSTQGWR